jgi:hypothetical protein
VDGFYEYIFRGNISSGASQLDTSQAARALHRGVARLRAGTASKKEKRQRRFLFYVGFRLLIWEGKFIQGSMLSVVPDACVMV